MVAAICPLLRRAPSDGNIIIRSSDNTVPRLADNL